MVVATEMDRFFQQITHLTDQKPVDLDAGLFGIPETPGKIDLDGPFPLPPPALWDKPDTSLSYIGIRVTDEIDDEAALARRLASAAAERRIQPIILSAGGGAGLRRFGFRVEDISAETEEERQALERQVEAFWSLAIIVDAGDFAAFG